MTKKAGPEDMDVVEMDAMDFDDWEKNMATSELPVAGLAALVRQTAAAPVVERPVRPAVTVHTPIPVSSANASDVRPPIVEDAPSEVPAPVAVASRLPSRRVLALAAGGAAVLGLVVGLFVVFGSSAHESAAPAATVASAPPAPAPTVTPPPAPAPARTPAPARAPAAKKPATAAIAPKPTVTKRPATHATAVHHAPSRPAKKRVATRTQAQPAASTVDPDVLERAHEAYSTGNEALFTGDTASAIRSYHEVVELSPALAFGYRGLGLAYAQSGDNAAAIKALRRYLELAPRAKDAALIRKRLVGLQHAHR